MRTQKAASAHESAGRDDPARLMMKIHAKNSEKMPIVSFAHPLMA